jgi:3D-(3,5/4)-trihydroxycyclohexane-1,2-dione acylhydrolase (decyclizing)
VIDFAANARSLGANAEAVSSISELGAAMKRARASDKSYLISIVIDGPQSTPEGGCWWEVGIPEVSERPAVVAARKQLEQDKQKQRI